MAYSHVAYLGNNGLQTGADAFTLTTTIPQGHSVIVRVKGTFISGSEATPSSITDTRGNTYTSLGGISGSDELDKLWWAYVSTALQIGDVITITSPGPDTGTAYFDQFSGLPSGMSVGSGTISAARPALAFFLKTDDTANSSYSVVLNGWTEFAGRRGPSGGVFGSMAVEFWKEDTDSTFTPNPDITYNTGGLGSIGQFTTVYLVPTSDLVPPPADIEGQGQLGVSALTKATPVHIIVNRSGRSIS